MNYSEILNKVSGDTGISPDTIDRAYKAFWKYIRDSIEELPLREVHTEEEFLDLRTNFNIPSLGKLTCTFDRYIGVRERFEHIKKLREKNEKVD